MKNLFLSFILILAVNLCYGQQSYLNLIGKVTNEKEIAIDSCWIKIKKDAIFIDSVLTKPNGKFAFDSLVTGHIYQIHFSANTYSYKIVSIDLTKAPENDYTKFPVIIDMSLFSTKYILDRKIEFLKTEPVAKGFYNDKIDNIEWDGAYFLKMKTKVEEAKK